jgi:hypothetical protein
VTDPNEFDVFRQRQERQERHWRIANKDYDFLRRSRSPLSQPWS